MYEQLGRLCRARCEWRFSCNVLSSSGLCGCKGLLIDIGGVFWGIVTLLHCYMLHVTLRDMQLAKRGRKNWSKNSI